MSVVRAAGYFVRSKQARDESGLHPITDMSLRRNICRYVPCVDGSELARTFFTFAALVGAAMCSAF
jgi:hypothetical protein